MFHIYLLKLNLHRKAKMHRSLENGTIERRKKAKEDITRGESKYEK